MEFLVRASVALLARMSEGVNDDYLQSVTEVEVPIGDWQSLFSILHFPEKKTFDMISEICTD